MEDTGGTSPVQFAIAEDVSLGLPSKPLSFGPVNGKLSSGEAIKEQDSPVRALVGLGRPHVDFHDLGDKGGLSPVGGSTAGPSSTIEA